MGLTAFVIAVFSSLAATVLWAELRGWSPRLSNLLLRKAVRRLPFMHRGRLKEEWAAYLADMPTVLSRLGAAAGFLVAAERLRLWQGVPAIRAVREFVSINRTLKPFRRAVRKFGGAHFRVRLVRRPCGNRHVIYHFNGPRALVELYTSFVEAPEVLPSNDSSLQAIISRDAIQARAATLLKSIQSGRAQIEFPSADLRFVNLECDTMQIYWKQRDARAVRILFAWVWRRKRASRNRLRAIIRR